MKKVERKRSIGLAAARNNGNKKAAPRPSSHKKATPLATSGGTTATAAAVAGKVPESVGKGKSSRRQSSSSSSCELSIPEVVARVAGMWGLYGQVSHPLEGPFQVVSTTPHTAGLLLERKVDESSPALPLSDFIKFESSSSTQSHRLHPSYVGEEGSTLYVHPEAGTVVLPTEVGCTVQTSTSSPPSKATSSNVTAVFRNGTTIEGSSLRHPLPTAEGAAPQPVLQISSVRITTNTSLTCEVKGGGSRVVMQTPTHTVEYEGGWDGTCAQGGGVCRRRSVGEPSSSSAWTHVYAGTFLDGTPHGAGCLTIITTTTPSLYTTTTGDATSPPSPSTTLYYKGQFERGSFKEGGVYYDVHNDDNGDGRQQQQRLAECSPLGDWSFSTSLPRAFNAPSPTGIADGSNATAALQSCSTQFVVKACDIKGLHSGGGVQMGFGASGLDGCVSSLYRLWESVWRFPRVASELMESIGRSSALSLYLNTLREDRLSSAMKCQVITAEAGRMRKAIQAAQSKNRDAATAQKQSVAQVAALEQEIQLVQSHLDEASTAPTTTPYKTDGSSSSSSPQAAVAVNPLTHKALQDQLTELEAAVTSASDALARRKGQLDADRASQAVMEKQHKAELKRIEARRLKDKDAINVAKAEKGRLEAELQTLQQKALESASKRADEAKERDRSERMKSLTSRAKVAKEQLAKFEKLSAVSSDKLSSLDTAQTKLKLSISSASEKLASLEGEYVTASAKREEQQRVEDAARLESQEGASRMAAAQGELDRLGATVAALESTLLSSKVDADGISARHQRSLANFAARTASVEAEIEAIESFTEGSNAVGSEGGYSTPPPSSSDKTTGNNDIAQLESKLAALDRQLSTLTATKINLERVNSGSSGQFSSSSSPSHDPLQHYRTMTVPELKAAAVELKASNRSLKASITQMNDVVIKSSERQKAYQAEIRILRSKGIDPRTKVMQDALDALDAEAAILRESAQRIPQLEAKLMALEEQSLVKQTSTDLARRRMSASVSGSAATRPHHLPPSGKFAYQQWQAPKPPSL